MTKKLLLLFFVLMAAGGLCLAQNRHLISATCVADGVDYDTNLPVPSPASTLTFKTVGEEISGYWTISAETIEGENIIIAGSDENTPCSEFVLETNTVEWANLKVDRYFDSDPKNTTENDYSEHGYGLDIEFVSTQGETDNISVIYYITPRTLPARPVISGIHFLNEEFDPAYDWFWGDFTFDIYCENATTILVEVYWKDNPIYFTIDDWKNERVTFIWCTSLKNEEGDNGHMTYTLGHDWGEVILLRGVNDEGFGVYSYPIFTTDYITDPDALARLEEMQLEVGVSTPNADKLRLQLVHDSDAVTATAGDGGTTVTLEVVGIDGTQRVAVSGHGTATADLATLAPGVYVVRASDGHEVKTIKVMIND